MQKSPSIVNLAKGLKDFHAHIGKITKDATNPFFNSKYATLSAILEAIKEPLQVAGLSFTQFPTGQNGLTTMLMHAETGEFMECEFFMQPTKNDPQAQGSVISYMRRYALAAVLGLNLDTDDDANAATFGKAHPAEKIWLNENTEEYTDVLEALKAKTITLQSVYEQFKVNKTVRAALEEYVKTLTPGYVQQQQEKAAVNAEKPWLDKNSKQYEVVVTRLKNGTATLSQVAQFFKLNKEIRAELQSIINESQPVQS